jgi:ABC-type nitrate/sulfonate/bicarbonate transport system substrate-binding protein
VQAPTEKIVAMLESGKIDAAGLWEPFLSQLMASGGPEVFGRYETSFYSEFSVLSGYYDYVSQNQKVMLQVLRAIDRAHEFYLKNAPEAQAAVDGNLSEHNAPIRPETWSEIDLHLGLSATLLTMLNEEAKWYQNQDKSSSPIDAKSALRGDLLRQVSAKTVTFE